MQLSQFIEMDGNLHSPAPYLLTGVRSKRFFARDAMRHMLQ
jgi:hypothetical protein